ncbi:50S ribosomal protein L6 [Candidatus Nanohalobium constans]|uniref:50S ribosomal protein L6 n=1 Tax=Candidatus Nanohalobium constans TaxID=2565781 RepID=A0A5Q0UH56_9ARCH|nr:50S ribosomal protein L6 [Candidatus Nanohalobium constans]QGA80968.1 50S ribosomal protein L6 [Candidatus Nanohalobium constans]
MESVTVEIPEDFTPSYDDGVFTLSNGSEVSKKMEHALVDVEIDGQEVEFSTPSTKKDIKSILSTFKSHVENMIEGLQDEHVYKMKGVYAHFPMTIKQEGEQVAIENFMGERNPRTVDIMEGVTVEVDGEDLTLRGADKDAVSQTAARIEQICHKGDRDPRTFQDGVYITSKGEEQ